MRGRDRPLFIGAAMRPVAQQGLGIALGRKPPQRRAVPLCLVGQGGRIESEFGGVVVPCAQVNAGAARKRFFDEGAAAGFAADQAHDLQFGVDARRGRQCKPLA
ncbi:hypothetical protein G6F57_019890 [Rhizopus arrhizus]|nr:hypothetical protein G6F57_019890 [Rhizopus arrhizus]